MLRKAANFAAVGVMVLLASGAMAQVGNRNEVSIFTEIEPFEVAGVTIPPGTYMIRVVNQTSGETYNRNVIQITSEDRKVVFATVGAVPHPAQTLGESETPLFEYYAASGGQPKALRSWYPAGSKTVREIVYPKSRAVALAEVTHETILSIPDETKESELATADFVPVKPAEPVATSEVVESRPAPPMETAELPAVLPATASRRPLLAGLGILFLAIAAAMRLSALRVVRTA